MNDLPIWLAHPPDDLPKAKHNWLYIVSKTGSHRIQCPKCTYYEDVYKTHIRHFCPNCGLRLGENYVKKDELVSEPLISNGRNFTSDEVSRAAQHIIEDYIDGWRIRNGCIYDISKKSAIAVKRAVQKKLNADQEHFCDRFCEVNYNSNDHSAMFDIVS